MWTREESYFWLLLALGILCVFAAVAAVICDYLESRYPTNDLPRTTRDDWRRKS